MVIEKSANQRYKESGSTLPFKEWLNREKAKGEIIFQKGVSDEIKKEVGENLEKPKMEDKNKNKILGLDKRILVLSAVVILGAVAYKMYVKK